MSPFSMRSGIQPWPSKYAWFVANPLPFVNGLWVWRYLSVYLNVGFTWVSGCLKKSWVEDSIGGWPHAGWDFCIAVFPYLLDEADLEGSIKTVGLTLNPFVDNPNEFLPSLSLEKHYLVTGV